MLRGGFRSSFRRREGGQPLCAGLLSLCCGTVVATTGAFQGRTVTEEDPGGRSLREAENPHSTDPVL
ncbi:hypothetical protein E5288_WYG011593 [Bos mutus]|uniref:Uncharacterized protein n=1 Tax=Bos mutus TaxID=72004 RepID=A0A6B0RL85_9CETA|nr:hypothetical protein [Bos mutus]